MKSLVESLFDKDLATKGFKIGDYYEVDSFGFNNSNVSFTNKWSYEILNYINLSKLKKDYKPADLSNVRIGGWRDDLSCKYSDVKEYAEPLEYIVSFINDFDFVPDKPQMNDTLRLTTRIAKKLYTEKYLKSHRIWIENIPRHDGLTFWIKDTKSDDDDNFIWIVYKKK